MDDSRDTPNTITLALFAQDEVLLLQRPDKHWELIGGHIQQDEASINAAHREAGEETSLVGLQLHFIKTMPFKCGDVQAENWVYASFLVERIEPTISTEHIDYQWLKIEEAVKMPLACKHSEILQDIVKRVLE